MIRTSESMRELIHIPAYRQTDRQTVGHKGGVSNNYTCRASSKRNYGELGGYEWLENCAVWPLARQPFLHPQHSSSKVEISTNVSHVFWTRPIQKWIVLWPKKTENKSIKFETSCNNVFFSVNQGVFVRDISILTSNNLVCL